MIVNTLPKIGTLLILINKHANLHVQVTVSTPSQPASYTKILGAAEGKVASALLGGHSVSIAKAVLSENDQKEAIIKQVLRELNDECTNLCKKTITSPFQLMSWPTLSGRIW